MECRLIYMYILQWSTDLFIWILYSGVLTFTRKQHSRGFYFWFILDSCPFLGLRITNWWSKRLIKGYKCHLLQFSTLLFAWLLNILMSIKLYFKNVRFLHSYSPQMIWKFKHYSLYKRIQCLFVWAKYGKVTSCLVQTRLLQTCLVTTCLDNTRRELTCLASLLKMLS